MQTTVVPVIAQPTAPVAPTASVTTQPTCAVATAVITVTAPTGAGFEYSVDGTNYQCRYSPSPLRRRCQL